MFTQNYKQVSVKNCCVVIITLEICRLYQWRVKLINLLYGLPESCILIGSLAVRKNPYPDHGPYFPYSDQ